MGNAASPPPARSSNTLGAISELLADARVRRGPPAGASSLGDDVPEDLRALFAASDGLDLADGTRILASAEIAPATAWLVAEKSLAWPDDLHVIGERDDLVIVRDLDRAGRRGGGGVLEAPTDGLSILARVAMDAIGYLEERLGRAADASRRAPERAAKDAAERRDEADLARALARPFYSDASHELAHAALTLGALRAAAGRDDAMDAFARAVDARVKAAGRGAEEAAARAAWKACAIAAERAGAPAIAAACRACSSLGPSLRAPDSR